VELVLESDSVIRLSGEDTTSVSAKAEDAKRAHSKARNRKRIMIMLRKKSPQKAVENTTFALLWILGGIKRKKASKNWPFYFGRLRDN
jgi:hypothetical protein